MSSTSLQSIAQGANPFGDAPIAPRPGGSAPAQTDQQRAIAEVQAAMIIARMNPRDPIAAMDRILNACTRPTLADVAVYTYARGGTDISGPSIRLAEAMAQSWGNMNFGIRELENKNGESIVQAFAWDVETNTRREVTFQVPHTRYTRSGGNKRLEDPRDIYELVANQGARRLRACILAIIPGDVTEAAVSQCETTMKTTADTSPEAMQKMVVAFEKFGVSRAQIETRIQRRLEAIVPGQVVSLKKIYASLRDGMSTAAEWFETISPAGATTTTLKDIQDKPIAKKPRHGIDQDTGEITNATQPAQGAADKPKAANAETAAGKPPKADNDAPTLTFSVVMAALLAAKTIEALDDAALGIDAVADEGQRKELADKYSALRAELMAASP